MATIRNNKIIVRKARPDDIIHIAALHMKGIKTGFISSLGSGFLKLFYRAISNSTLAFCIVAEDDGKLIGFTSGASDINCFYKGFLKKEFFNILVILFPKFLNFHIVKKIFETLLYPVKSEKILPKAKFISISISEDYRGTGLGTKLFEKLLEEFKKMGVTQFKIIVGSDLSLASRFYEKMGAILYPRTIEFHKGIESKIYLYNISI